MVQCSQVTKEVNSSCNWRHLATHKDPLSLSTLSQSCVAKTFTPLIKQDVYKHTDAMRRMCHLFNTSLPINCRTTLVEEMTSLQEIEEPQQVMSVIILHILTDVRSFALTAGTKTGNCIHLKQEDCDFLLKALEGTKQFHLESLRLEGVSMENGVISDLIRRSPGIKSVHVSGDICSEVLTQLEEHPRSLHSLRLDNAMVTDRDIVRSLLGSRYDIETLGDFICEGSDVNEVVASAPHHSLRHLSVDSHTVSACGGAVLLHFLPKLRSLRYTASLFDTLNFLQKISPVERQFSLTSMELWSPSESNLVSLQKLCPELRHLMIECYDPSLKTLEALSQLTKLESLTLRIMSEELILSAVSATSKTLQNLQIEFETSTSLSLETITSIQENCPDLQGLKIQHVCLEIKPGDRLPSLKKALLPELKRLDLSNSVVHPAILERILVGNNTLEDLVLDVNQEALTDHMLNTILHHNPLEKVNSISLGSGSLSVKGVTSLVGLPSLDKISLNLQSFPHITEAVFHTLKEELIKGNFRCALLNLVSEEC